MSDTLSRLCRVGRSGTRLLGQEEEVFVKERRDGVFSQEGACDVRARHEVWSLVTTTR